MCGIVGYVGKEQAAPILLNGLAKLEYRGYDSAGLAVRDGESPVEVVKAKGRLKALEKRLIMVLPLKELVVLDIQDGQHTESHQRIMPTHIYQMIIMLLAYIMELLRIIRN